MNLYLFVVIFRATVETRELLQAEIIFSEAGNANQLLISLRLKQSIMGRYTLIICSYFIYEIIFNGLIPTFQISNGNDSSYLPALDPYEPVK